MTLIKFKWPKGERGEWSGEDNSDSQQQQQQQIPLTSHPNEELVVMPFWMNYDPNA